MSKKLSNYFSIGEFAKVTGTTKHTLFHYHEIGIFSPALILDNDYRYYRVEQVEAFYVISALKALGMSLKEIRAYLDRKNIQELIKLLNTQEQQIESKIQQLTNIKSFISERKKDTLELSQANLKDISIKKEEAEFLLITEALPWTGERSLAVSIGKHIINCKEHGLLPPYSLGEMLEATSVAKGYMNTENYYIYSKSPMALPKTKLFEKAAGSYLTLYHSSGYSKINDSYQKLLAHAKKHKLSIGKYFFEDSVLDELAVEGYENFILKISILLSRC